MKKFYIFIFLILSIFLISCRKTSDIEIKKAKATITIGGIENKEPYSYSDKQGKNIGYNIDIIEEVFSELDYKVEYIVVTNESFIDKLHNEEYVDVVKYSKPIIKNDFNIFVKSSDKSIRNIEDLVGKKLTTTFLTLGSILFFIIIVIISINKILKGEVEQRTIEISKQIKYKEAIIDSLFDYLIILDNDLNVTNINRRVKEMINIENKDVYNKNIMDTELIKLINIEEIKSVYLNKEKILNRERKIDDENDIYVDYNIMPVIVDDEMEGVAITLKDITERKQMMKKIKHKDKMEILGRLTAGIAHEIRNPLASISMYLEILPEKINNPEYRKQISEDIPKEITRLNNLIKNLLEFSTPRLPQTSILNLKSEIEFVIRILQSNTVNNNIAVDVVISDDIHIKFDRDHLKQIIINIVMNAMEALKDIENPRIEIYCIDKGLDYLYLTISNNGSPIIASIAENIFEPFATTKAEGSGLGLSIISQLCKENDSDIYLDKDKTDGVTFIIKVPNFKALKEEVICKIY